MSTTEQKHILRADYRVMRFPASSIRSRRWSSYFLTWVGTYVGKYAHIPRYTYDVTIRCSINSQITLGPRCLARLAAANPWEVMH